MTSSAQPSRAPYKLNPADVSKLREATDCPMMECKKFLVQYEGDFEKAKAALLRGDWKYGKLITYARPGSRHQASPPSPAPAPAPEAPAPATPTLISSCFGDLFVQEEMVKTLSVTAEGRLMHNIWQRGRKGTPGHYAQEDVTDSAHEFLFEQLQLQPDVTLRSVLLLVSNCEGLRRVLRWLSKMLCRRRRMGRPVCTHARATTLPTTSSGYGLGSTGISRLQPVPRRAAPCQGHTIARRRRSPLAELPGWLDDSHQDGRQSFRPVAPVRRAF